MLGRIKVGLLLSLSFFFLFPQFVLAAFSLKIKSATPDSISSKDQEIEVLLIIEDLPSESFFRVAWQKEGGGSYFGYLKVNDQWIKVESLSSGCEDYYHVSDTSTTSAVLVTKIGEDKELSSGTYSLRAHRFTSTCKSHQASENTYEIEVNLPNPSPAPPPSIENPSEESPEPSPVPVSPSPSPRGVSLIATLSGEVLGGGFFKGLYLLESSPSAESSAEEEIKKPFLPRIFLSAGVALLLLAAGAACYTYLNEKNQKTS